MPPLVVRSAPEAAPAAEGLSQTILQDADSDAADAAAARAAASAGAGVTESSSAMEWAFARPATKRAGPIATSGVCASLLSRLRRARPGREGDSMVLRGAVDAGEKGCGGVIKRRVGDGALLRGCKMWTDCLAAAESRWTLPRLRLSQQLPGGPRIMRTSEKRRCQRARKLFEEGGPLEGHAQQGLQEERLNPNHCVLDPTGTALYILMQARGVQREEAAKRQAEAQAARKAARAARFAEEEEDEGAVLLQQGRACKIPASRTGRMARRSYCGAGACREEAR